MPIIPDGVLSVPLRECGKWLSGGTPSKQNADYWGPGFPWVSAKDLKSFRLYNAEDHITAIGALNGSRVVQPGTILILVRGMTLLQDVPICVSRVPLAFNQDIKAIQTYDHVDADYLAYWLLASKEELLSNVDTASHGTGRLLSETLGKLEVALPELRTQRVIAAVLSAFDDKIELNRRMNQTLEAMARALFKSWFVDFEPVVAKSEGRPTGFPPDLDALFPSEFEDSSLGLIPLGWSSSTVGTEFSLTMGQSPPGETYNTVGDGLPFYQGRADFQFRFPKRRVYCTAPTRVAQEGDTLVSVRAPVGDINLALEHCAIGRGVAAVRHLSGASGYTYQTLHDLAAHFLTFESEGTVFGSINQADFRKLPVVAPPDLVISTFEEFCQEWDGQILTNEREAAALTGLRDDLLPRLLSGEVEVAGLEEAVQ